ncbi:uncharacterized protein (DUF1800 family) [Litorivivens lipolytica]|uniref:Uncharacterized protein (DUF1800 family) n=1 Tax=Litorivivens lipolytica TaxID=1524264 RepID=A0A7W4Z5G9_9GAMM|nr:DUF1800 domain-containing protein [Litorivivens lipolytica]MBB3045800.1 uncharacterized protein (DUF1800 family) [Litorivivens lipolytica]
MVLSVALLSACNSDSSSTPPPLVSETSPAPPPELFEAFRLARQASFGPSTALVSDIRRQGIEAWVDAQLNAPSAYDDPSDDRLSHLQRMIELAVALEPDADWYPDNLAAAAGEPVFSGAASRYSLHYQNSAWFENALQAPDQLRQRVAYALSQILVVSHSEAPLDDRAEALAHYFDILASHAFGNFRELIGDVARSPAMGIYLSHQGNRKADGGLTKPDENFARELMQLFTIGLYQLNLDSTPKTDANGQLVPTYTQDDIEELSKVMTGWDLQFNGDNYGRIRHDEGSLIHPMEFNADQHESEEKRVLGQVIAQGLAEGADLDAALDILFQHANTAPFISRQLIQRLVSSNPSPAYVERVASVFENNGFGERGDLKAVVRAILLDPEARDENQARQPQRGKVAEPLLAYTGLLRAFSARPLDGWYNNKVEGSTPAVNGAYYFRSDFAWDLGQAALRSPSVFNFYSPDFVPQDAFYHDGADGRALVLPELQLRTPANIAGMQALLQTDNNSLLEVNRLIAKSGSIEQFVADTDSWMNRDQIVLVDYSPMLETFDVALDGVKDGVYEGLDSSDQDASRRTARQRAISATLATLELLLLGNQVIPDTERAALIDYFDTDSRFRWGSESERVHKIVNYMVQYIALSPDYLARN